MILLVGLGNPGKEYEHTPHNLGRAVLSAWRLSQGLPEPRSIKKYNGLISEGTVNGKKVMLLLPETFMNNSGEAVSALANFHKVEPANIWLLHDDVDIPLGNVRIAFGGGAAGHHGVESVAEKLGSPDFWRFRVGIFPKEKLAMPLDAYVLKKDAIAEASVNEVAFKVKNLLALAFEKGMSEMQLAGD